MINDGQKILNRIHVLLDALMVVIAYLCAYTMRFVVQKAETYQWSEEPFAPEALMYYGRALIFIVPGYVILYMIFGLYGHKSIAGRRREISGIFFANIIGVSMLTTGLYIIKNSYFFSGYMIFYFGMSNLCFMITERSISRIILFESNRRGKNQKKAILVGFSGAARELIDRVLDNPQWGFRLQGILDDNKEIGFEYKGIKVVGRTEELESLLEANQLDEIIITLGLSEYNKLAHVVASTEKSGVHTRFVPDYSNVIPTSPFTEDLQGLPLINIRHVPLMEWTNASIKRAMDIILGTIALILFSPVMLICVIAIKLTSPGPIIFCQERVGLHNRPFKMYKFRSMTVQTDEEEKTQWTTKGDARVTKFGGLMRKTSLDELPQIINVLKGDMSLIGPRPERPLFVEKFKEEIPRYMVKHQVRPGMTGWAQVNGYRGDTEMKPRIEHDLYYIENWSVGLDIKILFMTVFTGFVNKNAY